MLASLNGKTAQSAEVTWAQLQSEPVLAVGRHKDCDLRVSDRRVSLKHFDIRVKSKEKSVECVLLDRSSNGTLVNGTVRALERLRASTLQSLRLLGREIHGSCAPGTRLKCCPRAGEPESLADVLCQGGGGGDEAWLRDSMDESG